MNNKQIIVSVMAIIAFGTIFAFSKENVYHRGEVVKGATSHYEVGGYHAKEVNVPLLFGGIVATTVIYTGAMFATRTRKEK